MGFGYQYLRIFLGELLYISGVALGNFALGRKGSWQGSLGLNFIRTLHLVN